MDFSNIACWIWPLLAGLICGILGYLLGRLSGGSSDTSGLDELKRENSSLEADLAKCKANLSSTKSSNTSGLDELKRKNSSLEADLAKCKASLSNDTSSAASNVSSFAAGAATSAVAFDSGAAKAAYGKTIKENDLTVVEGIGPKISELFKNAGINTWAKLSGTAVSRCSEILKGGGKRFELHSPDTWPMQAGMAAEGKWAELKKWQDEHDYGKA